MENYYGLKALRINAFKKHFKQLQRRWLRSWITALRSFQVLQQHNAGEWHWLQSPPVPLVRLNRKIWRGANPSLSYYVLLSVSAVISAIGVIAGNAATIIGAMIVAPLMGPITGMAFGIAVGNRRMLKRSSLGLVSGAVITVLIAYFIASASGLHSLNIEILSRAKPTLLDLLVALAAGTAGAFAQAKQKVADALPGVAIAVALAPPLSVIGIGLAMRSWAISEGASLLFLTNLAGIVLSGAIVFIWQEYGSLHKAKRGLFFTTISVLFIGLPLSFSLRELIVEAQAKKMIETLIRRQTVTFGNTHIRELHIQAIDELLLIELEVSAPIGNISERQVLLVRSFLEEKLEQPLELDVRVLPMREFSTLEVPRSTNRGEQLDQELRR